MALGTGLFLIVVGAVLSFGVKDTLDAVNLPVIGYICIAAGVIALILSMVLNAQRSKSTHHEVIEHKDAPPPPPVVGK